MYEVRGTYRGCISVKSMLKLVCSTRPDIKVMDFTKPYTTNLYSSEEHILNYFLSTKVSKIEESYRTDSSSYFQAAGEKNAIGIFRLAAARVPAYKDFLKKHKINPDKIKSTKDFKNVPIVDKHNYLKAYPLNKLCLDGDLSSARIISCSSGSTGEPFFWPRGTVQEVEGGQQVELLYRLIGINKPTLVVIGFALGNWISGSFMYLSTELVSKKGYPLTTVTPGFSKSEIYRTIKYRGSDFAQVILMGYPPFIKDIIDEGEADGIDWRKFNIKFVFAAEGFSEVWRSYIYEKVKAKNYLTSSANIYGSADAGILAHETPYTIAIRTLLKDNKDLHNSLFNESRVPTLAQYDPRLRFFEVTAAKDLIFTANAGIPLVRYSIGDYGGIYSTEELERICLSHGFRVSDVLKKYGAMQYKWNLPCVYVFGRKDFTATLYGANIYPESIREALLDGSISKKVTGKFTMFTKNDRYLDQFLSINVELQKGVIPNKDLIHQVEKTIISYLRRLNSEYSKIYTEMNHRAHPEVVLFRYNEGEYFQPGTKHRWTKKS